MRAPAIPNDPALPRARGLFEGEGTGALRSFLEDRGWRLEEARPVQAIYRPGRSCLVRYRAEACGPKGGRVFTLCAETSAERLRTVPPPDGFAEAFGIRDPMERRDGLLVWAYPYDPSLAELPGAASGEPVRGSRGAVSVQPLRYRPRRRGVFRYREIRPSRDWRTSFAKVIPSRKAERTIASSRILQEAGVAVRAPDRVGRQTLVTPEMQGRSLRDVLVRGGSLPSPDRIAKLVRDLQRILPREITWTRPSPDRSVAPVSELILAILPGLRPAVERITDAIRAHASEHEPTGVVHGDLYEAQLLVGERFSLGVIDLDDVALGDPAMDAASFCAHLAALALSSPAASERLMGYRELARGAFTRELQLSPRDLAWREALCMLQLSTGPFRVLAPDWPQAVGRRVGLAVRLLEAA